jgi:anti-anti-sigma regulatory factor
MKQILDTTEQQAKEIVINSGERLTIETIAGFIQRIHQALALSDTIVIEFQQDVEMDITALQVFCSACSSATAEGKQFLHRGPPPKILLELATAAGSERCTHCNNNNISCFRQFGGTQQWQN